MSTTKTKKVFFYGWIIVAACFLMQAIPFGVAQNIQPQFIGYVIAGEGFTLTQFSLLFTIGTIVASVASPFVGRLFDRPKLNLRLFYALGAVLTSVAFALFGISHALWQFYGVAALLQVGTTIISSLGIPVLIHMWYGNKSGTALGIAFAGGGIGNVLLQQIAAHELASNGYGYSYIFFGIMAFVIGVPIALFLVRRPRQGELEAMEDNAMQEKEKNGKLGKKKGGAPKQEVAWGYSLKDLTKNAYFWLYGIGFALVGIYVSGMFVQFMAYFKTLNFSAATIGNIGSIFAVASILGNLFGGRLFDKIGIKNCLFLAGALVVSCGLCLLFAAKLQLLAYIFAIFLGIAVFAYIIGPSYMTGALLGNRFYGGNLGVVNIFFAIGYAFGAVIFGIFVDSAGYQTAWIFMTIVAGLSYVLLFISAAHFLKNISKKKAEGIQEAEAEKAI